MNRVISLLAALLFSIPMAAGPIVVRLANYIDNLGDPNSQTVTLATQVFSGSADCTSGAGAVTTTTGVDYLTGVTLNVAGSDSVLLTADPGSPQALSEQNGFFVAWGSDFSVAPFLSLPGDRRTICVGPYQASPTLV